MIPHDLKRLDVCLHYAYVYQAWSRDSVPVGGVGGMRLEGEATLEQNVRNLSSKSLYDRISSQVQETCASVPTAWPQSVSFVWSVSIVFEESRENTLMLMYWSYSIPRVECCSSRRTQTRVLMNSRLEQHRRLDVPVCVFERESASLVFKWSSCDI